MQKQILHLKVSISLMNMAGQVFHKKYLGVTDAEKVEIGGLYYLYTIAFFSFLLFIFFFTLST